MKSIASKVFWITGASSGIGRSLAELVINKGAKVVISSRNEMELNKLSDSFTGFKENIFVLPIDLGNLDNPAELATKVIEKFGRIDFLVNNGGISQRSLVEESSIEIDRKVLEVNFFGNIALAKAVLPIMIKQGGGHLVITSSVVGKFGFPLRSAYSASKQALHGFYESLRAENYKNNIKVTMVIPGRINTNISINAVNKDGKNHGEMDPGQSNGMSSRRAAEIIFKGIMNRRKEVLVGKYDVVMVHLRRFTPRLFYFLARKINPK